MENNDFTLEPSQSDPLQNLKNLKWLLLKINITCPHLTIAKHIHNAREKIALLIATLDFDLCGELIADIEKAKWEAAEKYSSAIFQIVKAEWLAWEIFSDCPIPFTINDEKEIAPYGDISWKTDYQQDTIKNAAESISLTFDNELVTGNITNKGEWHRCIEIARELLKQKLWDGVTKIHICGNVSELHKLMMFDNTMPEVANVYGFPNHLYVYFNLSDVPVNIENGGAK